MNYDINFTIKAGAGQITFPIYRVPVSGGVEPLEPSEIENLMVSIDKQVLEASQSGVNVTAAYSDVAEGKHVVAVSGSLNNASFYLLYGVRAEELGVPAEVTAPNAYVSLEPTGEGTIEQQLQALRERMTAAEGDIDDLETAVLGITTNYATKAEMQETLGEILAAIQALPDGQAVSAQVALNTAAIEALQGEVSQLGQEVGELSTAKQSLAKSVDGYLNTSGGVTAPSGTTRGVTDFISLSEFTSLVVLSNGFSASNIFPFVAFYENNAQNTFISGVSGAVVNGVIVQIPYNAKYARFSMEKGSTNIEVSFASNKGILQSYEKTDNITSDNKTLREKINSIPANSLYLIKGTMGETGEYSSTSLRVVTNNFIYAPFTIECNSGYKAITLFKYHFASNNELVYDGGEVKNTVSLSINDTNYIYRFNFGKDDGTSFSDSELVNIIKSKSLFYDKIVSVESNLDLINAGIFTYDEYNSNDFVSGFYNTSGEYADVNITPKDDMSCIKIAVKKGQVFTVFIAGGYTGRAYALTDNDRKIYDVAPATTNYLNGKTVQVTKDGFLYCSNLNYVLDSPKIIIQDSKINENSRNIDELQNEHSDLCISMFSKIGVCGASYNAGALYNGSTFIGEIHEISWGKILGRNCGIDVTLFASGGADTRLYQTRSSCLPALLAAQPLQLYTLQLGTNDAAAGVPLGSISDIHSDYTLNEDTYYGNMGRIIAQIQNHAPNAKIILSKPFVPRLGGINYGWCSNAIEEIAEHFGIPFIEPKDSKFLMSDWITNNCSQNGMHPTAIGYSGIAKALQMLIEKLMKEDSLYFVDYNPSA